MCYLLYPRFIIEMSVFCVFPLEPRQVGVRVESFLVF
jgi:hypothetical protein